MPHLGTIFKQPAYIELLNLYFLTAGIDFACCERTTVKATGFEKIHPRDRK